MAKLRFTPRAESDLEDIWKAIATENLPAADRTVARILEKLRTACGFPQMGARRPDLSNSARILIAGVYIVIYEPQEEALLVVAIVHGKRDPDRWLE